MTSLAQWFGPWTMIDLWVNRALQVSVDAQGFSRMTWAAMKQWWLSEFPHTNDDVLQAMHRRYRDFLAS